MVKIDDEFKSLIPPLQDDELTTLTESVMADGCRDAIVLWGEIIVDGHNRYKICTDNNIEFQTVSKEFAGRGDAKIWIIKNQFGRRNLLAYDRSRLAIALKPLFAAKAKENQGHGVDGKKHQSDMPLLDIVDVSQISAEHEPSDVSPILAKHESIESDNISTILSESESDNISQISVEHEPSDVSTILSKHESIESDNISTITKPGNVIKKRLDAIK